MKTFRFLQQGVTLIELIVTLAIVAILLGMAVPSFAVWIQNQQIRAAAESISNGLQIARATALNANAPVRFFFHDSATNQPGWTVCYWDMALAGCTTDLVSYPQPIIQKKSSNEGALNVRIGVSTATAGFAPLAPGAGLPQAGGVTFGGLGRPVGPAANNFTRADLRNTKLAADDERRLVATVSPSGAIRICDPKLASSSPQGCS